MIGVFDTTAARSALVRRKLRCPDCGQPLKPWGWARERTVRELGGGMLTVIPDQARCTGCGVTHIVLDAGLLPRRAFRDGTLPTWPDTAPTTPPESSDFPLAS